MGFTLPDPLPTGADELAELRAEAKTAFDTAFDDAGAEPTQDDIDEMRRITDAVETIDTAIADIEAARQRAEEARCLADRLAPSDETTDTGDNADADTDADGDETEEPAEETADTAAADEPEPVAAAATPKRTTFARAATGRTPDVPRPEQGWRLTTSAKNYESGIVDSLRVAREFGNLATGRAARVIGAGGRSDTTVAFLDREIPAEFTVGDQADAIRVLDTVTDESRLPGGSLVAAGGWCAPSERVYDFLPTGAATGLLSLPEISVRRGGISFPKEPDFADIYTKIGFHQTETQAQSNEEKTCFEIPCGDFEEVRLDAVGICITGGILQDKAWPELTRKYVDESLRLHQHKMNKAKIDKIVAGSTTVTGVTGTFGTAGAVLATLELQIADMKARHRIGRGTSLEGMAPEWLLSIIRADLAYRDEVLPQQVSDEQIRSHFATLGVNLQFVADWQNEVIGASTAPKTWPAEVKVALWPAGTWWSAVEPVINLGITYDATMLKTNRRILMFTEDGVAIGKRGPESRLVTIPVKVDGMVGLRGPASSAA
ncbi:major capsid protein [Corynebacterium sp.]|uniref:major capsid protein n=1 Tax=Corynebacterium sp. TaxID=1720 RepID=UPI0026DAA920|nr:major capsid protein [Corynebacterium sp.]MDO4610975.1 major capsid protein [Corynebacterium sp.]